MNSYLVLVTLCVDKAVNKCSTLTEGDNTNFISKRSKFE